MIYKYMGARAEHRLQGREGKEERKERERTGKPKNRKTAHTIKSGPEGGTKKRDVSCVTALQFHHAYRAGPGRGF